jgi:hypothetical protein
MTAAAAGDGHHSLHAEQHDPHHRAEADLVDKGLSEGAVGPFFPGETLVTDTPALVVED